MTRAGHGRPRPGGPSWSVRRGTGRGPAAPPSVADPPVCPRPGPLFAGTGGMLVSPVDGGVHRHRPLHAADCIITDLNMFQQPGPRAVGLPPGEPLIDGLPRSIPLWKIPPRSPGPQAPQHPVNHLPVIPPGPPPTVQRRQQRSYPLPRRVRQLTTTSHKINYPDGSGAERPRGPARKGSTGRWSAGSADHTTCRSGSSPSRSGCRRRGGHGDESAIPTRPESRRAPPSGRPHQPIHRRPRVRALVADPSSAALASDQHRWVDTATATLGSAAR